MNTYEISYTEFERDDDGKLSKLRRHVIGTLQARNGIQAIKDLLVARLDGDAEMLAGLDDVWTGGSNKRLVFAGITFEANKVS